MSTTIRLTLVAFALAVSGAVFAQKILPPQPLPVFRPTLVRDGEQPVSVETKREVVADNGLYRRIETTITFTNPNGRAYEGELEFPVPDGATVCGYTLEIDGAMEPGVVCEKEKARAAFDNEKRKGVDPGIVEHVKGNLWKTRIYPLLPRTPRKAMVAYVEPLDGEPLVVAERDPDTKEIFVGDRGRMWKRASIASRLRTADRAWILWDASASRRGKTATDRARLELLPEKGEWTLVVFRDVPEKPQTFTERSALLKAVDAAPCDGGTSLARLAASLPDNRLPTYLFSDEMDTLSLKSAGPMPKDVIFASRPDSAPRKIVIRKDPAGKKPAGIRDGKLLATAWAADRIADLSAQADARKDEFLALGRRYGVASPVASLIVLESLEQYLEHKIEPPATSRFHEEWKKRRAAEDDAIAAKREKTTHEQRLLGYWEERVKWWNDPIPKVKTPKSGLFAPTGQRATRSLAVEDIAEGTAVRSVRRSRGANSVSAQVSRGGSKDAEADFADGVVCCCAAESEAKGRVAAATIRIAAWDPKMPYLKVLDGTHTAEAAYAAYLKERDVYGTAPSFYLDCAGWFFRTNAMALGCRIVSNLAEMKLEDAGLWRTMGWRLREAGAYDAAVDVFRHVLEMRGEEPQSRRDLALVLTERGKEAGSVSDLNEAAALLKAAAFEPTARRSGRFGNDMQTCVLALEELNGLLAWCAANPAKAKGFVAPPVDAAYRRDLPLDLRIVLSWDTDETDVDLHVLEPGGEEAFYAHRRTGTGGFVSEDVTTGYGPEEYLKKKSEKGVYRVLANYFASHRQALTGAATVTATVYTGWGTADERRQVLSFRLDKPRDKCPIGEVTF